MKSGMWLLIALVQSQQKEIKKNEKLKLVAYKPQGRKKRSYKKEESLIKKYKES